MSVDSAGKKLVDAIAVASIVSNSTGLGAMKDTHITLEDFRDFLHDYQQEQLTPLEIRQLIQIHEPNLDLQRQGKLSFEGFARYLMDKSNYAFINETVTQYSQVVYLLPQITPSFHAHEYLMRKLNLDGFPSIRIWTTLFLITTLTPPTTRTSQDIN